MSEKVLIALIETVPSILTFIGVLWTAWRVYLVEKHTNGMSRRLENQAKDAGHAAGVADEKAAEKSRNKQ